MSGPDDGARVGRVADWLATRTRTRRGEPWLFWSNELSDAADDLLSVVADTTAGEATVQRADCDPYCMAPFGSHHERCPAARSGGAQDDGLRGRLEALVVELDEMSRNIAADARQAQEHGEGTYVSFWLGMAQARGEAADRLRRALAGPDDSSGPRWT